MYKMLCPQNLYDPRSTDFVHRKENRTTTPMILRGQRAQITEDVAKKKLRENFFTCRSELLWNNLDGNIVNVPNVNTFKNRLDKLWKQKGFLYDYESPINRLATS